MQAASNHENELGNGPIGFEAYQTYFSLPAASGQTDVTRGLWHAFTVGSVRVISLGKGPAMTLCALRIASDAALIYDVVQYNDATDNRTDGFH